MPLPPQANERIGRYDIEAVIGRGAMGVIYRAHDPAIDRKVALKLVRADLLEGDERADYIARFQREAQAAGRCSHPNIVAVYDFALHDGNPYLAMEFIDGITLQQLRTRSGDFAAAEIVSVVGQILDGLAAAHALGVVHRDIKPANVMLTGQGRVKVTDFGISRLDTSSLTGTGGITGTPAYMSPEQCRGDAVDARSDLFSVAVVLYELVTGAKPFPGTSQHEVWHKLLHAEPAATAALRPDVPAAVHAVIGRGLQKDPVARFQSAEAMAAALRAETPTAAPSIARQDASDLTVMMQPGPGADLGLDSSTMSTIERRLAQHVGPIARLLMRNALSKGETVESFCETLASNLPERAERESFREEIHSHVTASLTRSGRASPGGLPEAELALVQTELARFVGPIARLLVKRAAVDCTDAAQLWQRLGQHVDGNDRAAFLGRFNQVKRP